MSALQGFDRKSRQVLLLFAGVGLAAAVIWREHVSFRPEDIDPLLGACWVGMAALATHRVSPRHDAHLAAVAFAGGALIEAWDTRAGLWVYFTNEQPPLFILPAWPAAALATERVVRALGARAPALPARAWPPLYVLTMIAVVAAIGLWSRPGWGHPLTWVAGLCVLITALSSGDPRADLTRLVAGSLVGIPLEYWGTSRACWVYYSGETPPPVAVLAHGFATIAFARGVAFSGALAARLTRPRIE